MKIWVDADACPAAVREILFRAANRTQIKLTLVANTPVRIPSSQFISFILVPAGQDVADNEIVKLVSKGDLVVTADIPFAADAIDKGATAINPRGALYTTDNIRNRLSIRDFLEKVRSTGVDTGGPAPFNKKDRLNFANSLDAILNKLQRNGL